MTSIGKEESPFSGRLNCGGTGGRFWCADRSISSSRLQASTGISTHRLLQWSFAKSEAVEEGEPKCRSRHGGLALLGSLLEGAEIQTPLLRVYDALWMEMKYTHVYFCFNFGIKIS
jgi:hypothetical protein